MSLPITPRTKKIFTGTCYDGKNTNEENADTQYLCECTKPVTLTTEKRTDELGFHRFNAKCENAECLQFNIEFEGVRYQNNPRFQANELEA